MSTFAERLKDLMTEHGVSVKMLTQSLHMNHSAFSLWLHEKQLIEVGHLVRICDYFNCSLQYLLGKTDRLLDYTPQPIPPFYPHFRSVMHYYGFTRYGLVKCTGISDSLITDWKKGAMPRLSTLLKLSDSMDCTLDVLIGRDKLPQKL